MRDKLENNIQNYRLLSINRASKMLGIRYENVKKLVEIGRIKGVIVSNKRVMIPYSNLMNFLKGDESTIMTLKKVISIEETKDKIDLLFKKYEKLYSQEKKYQYRSNIELQILVEFS